MEYSGNIPTFNIQGTFPGEYSCIQYPWNIPQGIFPTISWGTFSEYSANMPWECSTNVPQTYICPVGIMK